MMVISTLALASLAASDDDDVVDNEDDDGVEDDNHLNLSPRLPGRLRLCSHRPLQLLGHPHVLHLENVDQVQGQDDAGHGQGQD